MVTAFRKLTKNTEWKQVAVIPVGFDTHHPQGFAKVGDYLSPFAQILWRK